MASTTAPAALRIGIIVLTLVTALVHISLIFPDPVFIMNGLGYLALLAALYLPIPRIAAYRNIVRWIFIGYTALTVILWLLIGERSALGFITTADEVILIALLIFDARRER